MKAEDKMDTICELMKLKPDKVKEYIDLHNNTWPELVLALRESGFTEEYIYIISNLVIVIMKCENFKVSMAKAEKSEVFMKWDEIVREWIISDESFFGTKEMLTDLEPVWRLDSFDKNGLLK
jgi:L-rhamnose mutarotase